MDTAPAATKPSLRERLGRLIAEYGMLALVVHYTIFGLSMVGFALAIRMGVEVAGAAGAVGTWGGAYLASQVIKPLRLGATFALTPLLAAVIRRVRRRPEVEPQGAAELQGPEPQRPEPRPREPQPREPQPREPG